MSRIANAQPHRRDRPSRDPGQNAPGGGIKSDKRTGTIARADGRHRSGQHIERR